MKLLLLLLTCSCASLSLHPDPESKYRYDGPSVFILNSETGLPLYQCHLPMPVVLATDVPFYDEIDILESLEYWNRELGTLAFIYAGYIDSLSDEVKQSKGIVIVRSTNKLAIPASDGYFPKAETVSRISEKEDCFESSVITYLAPQINRNYELLRWVMMHEFGHVLGAEHNGNKGNLMYHKIHNNVKYVRRARRELRIALRNIYNIPQPKEKGLR